MDTAQQITATEDNFVELLGGLSPFTALELARSIASKLRQEDADADDGYWLEKPWKFPEFWVPAINGTLEEADFSYTPDE
jgi:hypothetical protein